MFEEELMSELWQEANATAVASEVLLDTFEFRHSTLNPPYRFVSDTQSHSLKLEDDAPVHAGEWRTFDAVPISAVMDLRTYNSVPYIQMTIDNIGRELQPIISEAVRTRESIVVRYRGYCISDKSVLGHRPVELVVNEFETTDVSIVCTASLFPLHKFLIPRILYDRKRFPALIAQAS